MNTQSINDVHQFCFQNLPQIQNLQSSATLIETYIKGHGWTDSFNCITQLRKINKYFPQYIPDILDKFSNTIHDLLITGKTLLVKNIFKLIKQLFDAGQQINVQKAVFIFLPILIKKASTEIGNMKNMAQQVLTSFCLNCGYEVSFIITSQFCCDKNSSISEFSIKLLTVLIQNIDTGIMQLSQNTLMALMRCLSNLIDGKRKNISNLSLDICMSICNSIGSDNYLQLMQYCLKSQQVQLMASSMQTHRLEKEKPIKLKQALKHRKTQKFNADFFNDNKYNNNFIPLNEKMNNMSMNNLNNENYNYDQYNYNNSNNYNNYQ